MTGLDYTDQRYYASTYGRFNSPDPYSGRYIYALGDPVNSNDPAGLLAVGISALPGYDPTDLEQVVCPNSPSDQFSLYIDGVESFANEACITGGAAETAFVSAEQASTPSCEDTEIAYVNSYLNKRNSPLAAYAGQIVESSDSAGIDDRFIVALAGAESSYGKSQQNSPTWGYYNVFSNASHCQALAPDSDCYKVDPYTSYSQAITGAVNLLTGPKYFGEGLVTVGPSTRNTIGFPLPTS